METSARWDSSRTLGSCSASVRARPEGERGWQGAPGATSLCPCPLSAPQISMNAPRAPTPAATTRSATTPPAPTAAPALPATARWALAGPAWVRAGLSGSMDTPLPCSSPSFPHPAAVPHLFPPPDVNECLQFPAPCAFECRNLRGSYECLCPAGRTALPGGQCGTAGTEGGDTTGSVSRDTPVRRQGPSSRPRARSFYTQLALRRVAKEAGMGARSPPCPTGYSRKNGTCTGERALGKGGAGSSESPLSPKGTARPSCCPAQHFASLLCWEGQARARLAQGSGTRGD